MDIYNFTQNFFEKKEPKYRRSDGGTVTTSGGTPQTAYEAVDTYEQAINKVGFGRFNVMVLLMLIPMELAMQFQMYGMSYAVIQVECDLNLGSINKGILITSNFIGMIPAGLLWNWGADVYGRRKLIIIGMIAHTLVRIGEVFAMHYFVLVIFEVVGGMIICGPHAIFLGAIFDFHSSIYRKRILLVYIIIICVTNNIIALIALFVMSNNYRLFGLFYEWNVFMAVFIAPSVFGFIGAYFLPESPKYLLRADQDEAALRVMRYIARINKSPVRLESLNTVATKPIDFKLMSQKSKLDNRTIKPYRRSAIIASLLQGFTMAAEITAKQWIPMMFASLIDTRHMEGAESGTCKMLDFGKIWRRAECNLHHDFFNTILYCLIVSAAIDLSIPIFAIINGTCNRKDCVLLPFCVVAAAAIICTFLTTAIWQFVLLISLFLIIMSTTNALVITVIYEAFPPNIRLSRPYIIALTVGRIFVVLAEVAFSFVYSIACTAPFTLIGCLALCAAVLSVMVPRKREMKV